MDTLEEIVACNLTELRKNARLTQSELAEKIKKVREAIEA